MKVYTYSEARQRFAELLRHARREGQVQIRRRDGEVFVVQPAQASGSALDVPGVDSDLTSREIVALVRDSRSSSDRLVAPKARPADQGLQPTRPRKRHKTRPRG